MRLAGTRLCSRRDPNADVLVIGAYSVVREVLHDGLMPAFAREWKQRTGRPVTFEESYNASGAQARAIASGFDADVAILSHEGDMELLVKAARVKPTWNDGPSKGVVTHSLVVIGHRPGNPKSIKGWTDLANPGVGVLYPDPKTSGGARWNINAIYGSAYLSAREANNGQPDLGSIRTSWQGSRPTWSTWISQAGRVWPISPSAGPVTLWSLTRTSCYSETRTMTQFLMYSFRNALDREPSGGGRDGRSSRTAPRRWPRLSSSSFRPMPGSGSWRNTGSGR